MLARGNQQKEGGRRLALQAIGWKERGKGAAALE